MGDHGPPSEDASVLLEPEPEPEQEQEREQEREQEQNGQHL